MILMVILLLMMLFSWHDNTCPVVDIVPVCELLFSVYRKATEFARLLSHFHSTPSRTQETLCNHWLATAKYTVCILKLFRCIASALNDLVWHEMSQAGDSCLIISIEMIKSSMVLYCLYCVL